MTYPSTIPQAAGGAPPPYPDAADAKIRQIADIFNRRDIFRLLDDVRMNLLGNVVSVQKLADEFARNRTLADAKEELDNAVQSISGTWTGRAADQFGTYVSRVGDALDKQQSAVANVSGILVGVTQAVVDTYAKAIELLGVCAAELAKLSSKMLIAIVTAEIPLVDIFTSKDVLDTVIDAFGTLIQETVKLFADADRKIGEFWGQANALVRNDTDFPEIPELLSTSGVGNEKQWRVDPTAFPE